MVRAVLPVLATVCLPSCAPQPAQNANATGPVSNMTFKVNGTPTDEAGMLAARKSVIDKQVAGLAAESDPIKGHALILLPDHDRLRPFVAQQQAAVLKRVVMGQALEAMIDEEQQGLRELSDALVKNGAFQTITVEERNDVIDLPTGDTDYVIVFQVRPLLPNNTGAWLANWQVHRNGNPQTMVATLDPGTPVGAPRLASFVKSVREDALRLGGTSVAGKTSATLPAAANGTPAVASTGTGIIVDKQGGILTNAHVVNACTEPRITDTNSGHFKARIVVKDQANDLALLKADHRWPQAATLRDDEPKLGATAIVSGFPLSGLVASSMSVTAGMVSATAGPRDDSRLFQISAPVQPGNSGGPVLDAQGHVAGIVTSQLNGTLLMLIAGVTPQNVNFAIKASIMRNFLAAQNVDFAHAADGGELSTAEVSALAQRFTVRIECGAP
jgi:S1-C subfamily serine protease